MINLKKLLIAGILVGSQGLVFAQQDKNEEKNKTEQKDSTSNAKKEEKFKLKKYEDVIKPEMIKYNGFITTYTDTTDFKYFMEIPQDVFNKDILVVNRIAKASTDMRNGSFGLVGDKIGEAVYKFEEGPRKKLFLRRISFTEYAKDSTQTLYDGIKLNNVQAIAEAFPIEAYNTDSTAVIIDVTKFLDSDNDILYFANQKMKDRSGVAGQQNEKSFVKYMRSYDNNLEIRAVKTYAKGQNPTAPNYTLELNSSFILLPEKPMQPRLVDERVGYFSVGHRDFNTNPQSVTAKMMVKRWRLEPKPEDEEKYLRGELVEPQKPIVFYIDPATPKKWVPYLIQGVNDWQKAFEKAGFKNAIFGKEAPTAEEDSTWSLENANYSAIIYRPSEIANAMGPSISDPRSGEIIESHVFWFHNVMKVLKEWYMIQAGAIDPRARKPELDDELMGELIRFVSSHEIGHAIGLLHNFGASSTVPVEKLRDKEWVEKNGHTPSIMDYARFNYVAQPEDNIGTAGIYPRINDYDNWAITWGYRWRPEFKNEFEEQKALTKIVTDSLAANHRLWFGSEAEPFDPRSQNEDLGDDAVLAGTYGIKNLKRIVPQIIDWNSVDYKGYNEVKDVFGGVFAQYNRYLGHALKNIGGVYHDVHLASDDSPVYHPVEKEKQQRAIQFISDQLFDTPNWLNEKSIFNKLDFSFGIELSSIQKMNIERLIARIKMSNLLNAQYEYEEEAYTLQNLFDDLNQMIFRELHEKESVDFYRRNLQKIYVNRLIQQVTREEQPNLIIGNFQYNTTNSDIQTLILNELRKQKEMFEKLSKSSRLDDPTRTHLSELAKRIKKQLDLDS
ncbi:zinc-dependent metalloprotease [Zunongwangia atlantica]|uniref:Zinc-dependent metalloprotease n=1 Tax=Zunongwangia atlantica 22II14-10F7 TaxID=1185767 RepID=A0A1Y1T392_9FLAO|nr:zinc-dependent metalloprotease [Zunongwangia atlantica]ORL45055.1 hypothetical protein IIF7_13110 [Zunongwangia atlantica 22II14-10F7]